MFSFDNMIEDREIRQQITLSQASRTMSKFPTIAETNQKPPLIPASSATHQDPLYQSTNEEKPPTKKLFGVQNLMKKQSTKMSLVEPYPQPFETTQ